MSALPNPLESRQPDHPIEPLFLRRWSPRAMSGAAVTEAELMCLFEAARWAPSSYNEQEWRFLYARAATAAWGMFFNLLAEANQVWCARAGALLVALSHKVFARNRKPNPVHSLDAGMAVQNLLLQGTALGLATHPMAGFNAARARADLRIPDDYNVEAMIAVGRPGDPDQLPAELRGADRQPSGRRPARDSICEGTFAFQN